MTNEIKKIERLRKNNRNFERMLIEELESWNKFYEKKEGKKIGECYYYDDWKSAYDQLCGVTFLKGWSLDLLSEYINLYFPKIICIKRLGMEE